MPENVCGAWVTAEERERIGKMPPLLLSWYAENQKELPWRETKDPYRVWISEIMLQQTRIETVIPYYLRFLRAFPDVSALAAAPEDQILKLWEGLGYYSRARNLGKTARMIMAEYGGAFPQSAEKLRKLPGIGDYTAGAIASIAFGKREPAVDGNVLRVCARYLASDEDILLPATRKKVRELLCTVYPDGEEAGHFTQAVMELGETVCLPGGEPKCGSCPLAGECLAHRRGEESCFPRKSAAKARRIEEKTVLLLSCGERYALCRRPEDGLLAGMWELPNRCGHLTGEDVLAWLKEIGTEPVSVLPRGEAVHIFTHVEWHMIGYAAECAAMPPCFLWEEAESIRSRYAIPTAFRFLKKEIRSKRN